MRLIWWKKKHRFLIPGSANCVILDKQFKLFVVFSSLENGSDKVCNTFLTELLQWQNLDNNEVLGKLKKSFLNNIVIISMVCNSFY